MSILSTIFYIAKQETVNKNDLNKLKFKTIFFIYNHDLQEQNFFNKLIASDFLML